MLDKTDLQQISQIVKNEITNLKVEMNQRFKEQDERITEKFKEQDERITQEISNQMLVFDDHYGRALTIAVEGLNHRNSKIDVQNQRLDNLEKICNLNSAYVYNHEERIHNLEKAN